MFSLSQHYCFQIQLLISRFELFNHTQRYIWSCIFTKYFYFIIHKSISKFNSIFYKREQQVFFWTLFQHNSRWWNLWKSWARGRGGGCSSGCRWRPERGTCPTWSRSRSAPSCSTAGERTRRLWAKVGKSGRRWKWGRSTLTSLSTFHDVVANDSVEFDATFCRRSIEFPSREVFQKFQEFFQDYFQLLFLKFPDWS